MNYRRGLIRVYVVTAIAWYLAAGLVLYPKWDQANHARQEANRILLKAPDEDGTVATFTDELVDLSGFTPVSKSSDPFAKYGGSIAGTPASKEEANNQQSNTTASSGNLTGASLGDSRADLKKKLSPMRFDSWQAADHKASESRPIGASAIFLLAPGAVYLMSVSIMWIVRGFRSVPTGT